MIIMIVIIDNDDDDDDDDDDNGRLADTHEMPAWVQTVFLQWLPWLLHMSRYSV